MSLLHRLLANAAENGIKNEVKELVTDQQPKHTPEQFAEAVKALYHAANFFKPAADASKTPLDDIGLRIIMDPLKEIAQKEGIEL